MALPRQASGRHAFPGTYVGPSDRNPRLPSIPDIQRRRIILILSFLALLLVAPLLAYSVLQLEGPRIQQEAQAELNAIGKLKANQIEAWLAERHADATMLMSRERFIREVENWLNHRDPEAEAQLAIRLASLRPAFLGWELLDAEARVRHPDAGRRALLKATAASGRPSMSDLYRDGNGEIWLDLVVPLIQSAPRKYVGAVVLRIQARTFLFPHIQTWPGASPSAETLLVRKEGDQVLFLNELRHVKDTTLALRLPLATPDLPAAIALREGKEQVFEGRDYRGARVLASVRPIQGTPWFLVAKVDREEVLQPLYKLVTWVGIVAMFAIIVVALILHQLWRQQQRNHQLALLAQTGERDRLLSLFYDLPFMGMAIVNPEDGRWMHANAGLCELLGYHHEELVNTTTWRQLTHPEDLDRDLSEYQRVLSGASDGYQLEKRFLRKDGGSIDTALSAKGVKRPDGSVEYIVMTVRDISERKRLEQLQQERRRDTGLLNTIAAVSTDSIFVKDGNGKYLFYNNAAARGVNLLPAEVVGRDDTALFPREQAEQIMARDREVLAGGEPVTFEETLDTAHGPRTFLTTKGPLLDEDGNTLGLYGISRDITERRLALEALRASEERYRSLVEQAADGIFVSDAQGHYLDVNSAGCQMLGYAREELLGLGIPDVLDPSEQVRIESHIEELATGAVVVSEWMFRRKDGSSFPGEVCARQLEDGRLQAILRDISDRKTAEEALRYQLDLLRGITEKSTNAIFINDMEGCVTALNPEAERLFGYSAEELAGQVLHDVIHPRHADDSPFPMHECPLCHVYANGETIRNHEAVFFRKDGVRLTVMGSNSAIESNGRRVGATLVLQDITAIKQTEKALREREEDLNRAQAVGHIGSWRLDVRNNKLTWSDQNHRLFDVPQGTLLTYEHFLSRVHPDDRDYVDQQWQIRLRGEPYDIEHRLLLGDTVKWVREKAELEFDGDGNLLGGFGITQDISDIKAAEQALRDSEERFQLAAEIGHLGTWDWNVKTNEVFWSRGHYEILGYREGEVSPSYAAWVERVHPEDRPGIEAEIQRSMRERVDYTVEFRVIWPNGAVHWMSARGRYQYGEEGACLRMLGIMADITSLKQAELALREADQRKDEFLAMLAHELRNPLAPIRNAAFVLGRLDLDEPRVNWAREIIEHQVNHLTHLVDELLDVSRIARGKINLQIAQVRLEDLIRQSCESVQPLLSAKGHRLQVTLGSPGVVVQGDLVRLVQVLQNLLNNAAKFTPDGGRIELIAQRLGPKLEIQVRDNGMGIPADLLPHVFDLFRQGARTLDRSQGGLGIGLTLVQRLVELHGGQVLANSAGPGQGAVFTVWLPVTDAAIEAALPAADSVQAGIPRLRVLVVEDDAAVAESMVVFLEMEGHQSRSARSGEEALSLLETFQPQVVLLDIGLPGQDGYAVARKLRQLPGGTALHLIALSGYGHPEAIAASRQAGFDHYLVKPADPGELAVLLAGITPAA